MMAVLRRILIVAFIAVLAGLGVFVTAVLGRWPRKRVVAPVEELVPLRSISPSPARAGGGRALAFAIVCLLALLGSAGVVYESRDTLFGGAFREANENAKPLAALSPSEAGSDLPNNRSNGLATGSVRSSSRMDDAVTLQPAREPASAAPGFDVVRVEPNGDAVIAGHTTPNATVELLVDGKAAGRARANADGRFTFMPPALPTGSSEIGLRATDAKGDVQRAPANVSVVIAPNRDTKPLIAVTSPGRPTMVLSQPDRPDTTRPGVDTTPGRQAARAEGDASVARSAPLPDPATQEQIGSMPHSSTDPSDPANGSRSVEKPAAPTPPKVVAIDAQNGGKLFVTAHAAAGAEVRLYLNDTLIAPATVGRDGTVTFAIGHGVRPGDYRVRLDVADPVTGKVRDRAEVPFAVPAAGHDVGIEDSAGPTASGRTVAGGDAARRERSGDPANPLQPSGTESPSGSVTPESETGSSEVFIAGIETARIERGDSLWRISRRVYGEGDRYTLIYDANQDQIRDPDLIYPGQVLVLPNRETSGVERVGKRG